MRRIATMMAALTAAGNLAAADTNHCEIAVTGEVTATIKADASREGNQGKLAASTDYWLTEAQLRKAVEMMVGIGGKLSAAEKQRKVDEAMKKDPRFMVLVINCLSDDGGLIFSAATGSKYADVPMKPGSYPIVATARPAGFITMFHVTSGGKRESYAVKEPGMLVVTRFDRKGIAGTFSFKAEQLGKAAKKVEVTGSFNYGCSGDACEK